MITDKSKFHAHSYDLESLQAKCREWADERYYTEMGLDSPFGRLLGPDRQFTGREQFIVYWNGVFIVKHRGRKSGYIYEASGATILEALKKIEANSLLPVCEFNPELCRYYSEQDYLNLAAYWKRRYDDCSEALSEALPGD